MAKKITGGGIAAMALNANLIELVASSFTYVTNYDRSSFGFAWFLLDTSGTLVACDLGDDTIAYMSAPAGATYQVVFFACPTWDSYDIDSDTTILQNAIVYNEDAATNMSGFFRAISNHTKGADLDEPGVGANTATYWEEMACIDYNDFVTAEGVTDTTETVMIDKAYVDMLNSVVDFSYVMDSCYNYTFTNANTTYNGFEVQVAPYDDVANPTSTTDVTDSTHTVVLSADGVYYITITPYTGTYGSGSEVYYAAERFVIYEFCILHTCMRTIMDTVFCKGTDPCCQPCSNEDAQALSIRRYELNKMVSMYFFLLSMIHLEHMSHLGLYSADQDRTTLIGQVYTYWSHLSDIATRCGDCSPSVGGTSAGSSSGCSNC